MKRFSALIVFSAIVLTGCAPGQTTSSQSGASAGIQLVLETSQLLHENATATAPVVAPQVIRAQRTNEWTLACRAFKPRSTKGFGLAYDAVIADTCRRAKPNSFRASVDVSPSVTAINMNRYLNSLRFHESAWGTRMSPTFTFPLRVVFSESDRKWWAKKQRQYLLKPDLGWFTSKSEGFHCRVMPDGFCPKHFEGELTKSGSPVEFRIIGNRLTWQNWQLTNGAHEAVHLYQESHSQNFWSFWYIEGQATFFELAMARLLNKSDSLRKMYVIDNPRDQDSLKIRPTSTASVVKFFKDCNLAGNGCASFKYGGASLFHEKLVLDYGLNKYFEWQDYLNLNMPRGDQAKFTPSETEALYKAFAKSFVDVYGITQEHFETKVMPQYFLDSYRALGR